MDPFAALGLTPSASEDEVRRAYRRLAQRYHPDHAPGDPLAAERFRRLHAAYNAALEEIRERDRAAATQGRSGATFAVGGRMYHRTADGRLWWWSPRRDKWVPIAGGVLPTAGHVAGRGAARLLRWWRG